MDKTKRQPRSTNEQHKPPVTPWRAMRSGRSELGADAAATGAMAITTKMLVPVCGDLDDDEEAREMEQIHQA